MSLDTAGGHPDMDYKQAIDTYKGFTTLVKVGTVACVVLLIGMAVFLL
ncbi:MAG: aa3-type cytochrome c oxidase subunit IV [Hyphomicrobiaceae bacterium]